MSDVIVERDPRNRLPLLPLDYEDRTLDVAIEAIDDIAECDRSAIYIQWSYVKELGVNAPVLYILFRSGLIAEDNKVVGRVHMAEDGLFHPVHAVLLATVPENKLLEGQKLKDHVRRGVEDFLRLAGIKPSPMPGVPLEGKLSKIKL